MKTTISCVNYFFVIEISDVTKQYYSLVALNHVSLRIPPGEVVGLLGPNGAGKTTLFKLIAGLLIPDSGSIRPAEGSSWPTIGYKPERLLFPNQMRVHQYLEMVAKVSNVPSQGVKTAVSQSLAQVGLLESADKKIGDCSKGMRQRLGLAQALIGNPSLLLLDEPSNGLDPTGQVEIDRCIQTLHQAGKTIIMSSHQLHEVTQTCTQIVILNRGRVLYQSSMAQALATKPHAVIEVDRDLGVVGDAFKTWHPGIQINGRSITLQNEALTLRRHMLKTLLHADFDILRVEQKHATLADIYAEAVQ